jgi:hypothetical protein
MRVLLRSLAASLMPFIAAPPAFAQDQNRPVYSWAFPCQTEDPPGYFDADRPQYLWSARDLPDTQSTPDRLTIKVKFLGDVTPEQRVLVAEAANDWIKEDAATAIRWDFLKAEDTSDAHIRIRFSDLPPRSAIGTMALRVPPNEETMRLPRGDKLTKWVAYHQFGHALGLAHEYIDRNAYYGWNVSRIFEDYWQNGWCEKRYSVDLPDILNCLTKIEKEVTLRTKSGRACPGSTVYDPHSIMLYPVGENWLDLREPAPAAGAPAELQATFRRRPELTRADKDCVRQLYSGTEAASRATASVMPRHFQTLYRICPASNVSSCTPIEVVRNDAGRLEFELSEPSGRQLWVWEKKAAGKTYALKRVSQVVSGKVLQRQSELEPRAGYYQGRITGEPDCGQPVYFTIGETCPERWHIEVGSGRD